jgi:hypothetical protein
MQFVVFGAWRVKWLEACRRLAAVINKARVCFAHIWLSCAATADVSPEASLRGLRATNKEQVLIVAYLGCASSSLSDACLMLAGHRYSLAHSELFYSATE